MGVTRSELFTDAQNELALAAKVLAHPARIAIIEFLLQSNSCINGELVNKLGLSQATISQHLRELKEAGILQGSIEGTRVNYCINPIRWTQIQDKFHGFFNRFQPPSSNECC